MDQGRSLSGSPHEELRHAIVASSLPGEISGLSDSSLDDVTAFLLDAAAQRTPDTPLVHMHSRAGDSPGERRILVAVINDDMPFLVDSISRAVTVEGIVIHRLLHPVVSVQRDTAGMLRAIEPQTRPEGLPESFIYLELDRADAKIRRRLESRLLSVLGEIRAAVEDWPAMQAALETDARLLANEEGAALLRWFLDRNFTQLGHQFEALDGAVSGAAGILRVDSAPLWSSEERAIAVDWFTRGNDPPLVAKSIRKASVHRHVPLDLLIVPKREGGLITGLSIHAGLWTSSALRTPAQQIPVLRRRLDTIEEKHGFDPYGHAGKALHHVLASLPNDLLIAFAPEVMERLALEAMSLADRPRSRLILEPDILRRHLVAFVWLQRDEVSTARRHAIGDLLSGVIKSPADSWAMELGDGDLALIRFTFRLAADAHLPDAETLDRQIAAMLRGWPIAVETALAESLPAARATRLAINYASTFPLSYRERYDPAEAASDIRRLSALASPEMRDARFYRIARDEPERLRLKLYRADDLLPLSAAVPVLENFGLTVLKEVPSRLTGKDTHIHEFLVALESPAAADALMARAALAEAALADVLSRRAENDAFNQLIVSANLDPRDVQLFRAWFRYMRQAGLAYGIQTVVDALRRAPDVASGIIALFDVLHDPAGQGKTEALHADAAIDEALLKVGAIDDDHILRWLRALVKAIVRTNAFAPAAAEALAFKIDSRRVPGLPAPVPWREIWVYSKRIEGVHMRGGPIARGGIRWSDRRDDFRTEILGLMKAQIVKNAVIVPTGAKGGFYAKDLPSPGDRDAWLAEGTEAYRIFIRALLSITDNVVDGAVVHPDNVAILDDDDPYFVVAADKGTASFSDVANAIAVDQSFWLGDAFASGGSHGYDHKAMGITARGAWISVQRHFAEMGIDVQSDPVRVAGCGDMSGDVFGNGMLQSKAIRLVAAFDHRHIFLDPDPHPARSWTERARLFSLARSSWADYDSALISKGGGVFPRTQKAIPLSPEVRALLDIEDESVDPSALIAAILESPVDLFWFGGIGTYIKATTETNGQVGDPANDIHRVNGADIRARVVGEGANLAVTQAGRIQFALKGGRINTDFIDNSAGVDCSDNEVNIKILLNREMREGGLCIDDRNALLRSMTDAVADLVLEDNRLQTLALSLAEQGSAEALPAHIRIIEMLEGRGRINRTVDGLASNDVLNRRLQDRQGLTRPELAILLSHTKMALQQAIEGSRIAEDPLLTPLLDEAFPAEIRERFTPAIRAHRLRSEIIATKLANRIVNRLGFAAPLELGEEEGVSLAMVASAYAAVESVFDLQSLWYAIETAAVSEPARLALFSAAAAGVRLHIADMLRCASHVGAPSEIVDILRESIGNLDAAVGGLLRHEASLECDAVRHSLAATGADGGLVDRIVRLRELDGAIGNAMLARSLGMDALAVTRAYVRLGEALGLDWARVAVSRFQSVDGWERLLAAGLGRDFEQLRLDFLARMPPHDPVGAVEQWLEDHRMRVYQFRALVDRARVAALPTAAMLAQIASQARILLSR